MFIKQEHKNSNLTFYLRAFSLVEISVVILVIGILIAGISKGVDLYNDYKVHSLRKLVTDSPVSRIPDLVAWWESTQERSFNKSEMVDGANISNWYDYNPNSGRMNSAKAGTPPNKPKYRKSSINGLPAVDFRTGYLQDIGSYRILGNKLTFFIVTNLVTYHSSSPLFVSPFSALSSTCNVDYVCTDSFVAFEDLVAYGMWKFHYNNMYVNNGATFSNGPLILSTVISGNTLKSYSYGTFTGSGGLGGAMSLNVSRIYLGARYETQPSQYYRGTIGEIIIYNRDLTDREHKSILNYLSKKWSIDLKINF